MVAPRQQLRDARRVWRWMTQQERRQLLRLMLAMIAGMLLEVAGIGLLIPLVALLFGDPDGLTAYTASWPGLSALSQRELAVAALLAFLLFYIGKVALLLRLAAAEEIFPEKLAIRLSQQVFARVLAEDQQSGTAQHRAADRQRILDYPATIARPYAIAVISLVSEGIVIAGMLAFALLVRPAETLALLSIVPLLMAGIYFFNRHRVARLARDYHTAQERRSLVVDNALAGKAELKLYQAETFFAQHYADQSLRFGTAMASFRAVSRQPRLLVELGAVAAMVLVLLAMTSLNDGQPDLVVIAVFGGIGIRLLPSLARLSKGLQDIGFGSYALHVLAPVMADGGAMTAAAAPRYERRRRLRRGLRLRSLAFAYAGGEAPVFEDFSFELSAGETLGITGGSGCGKSTLARLLAGLLEADNVVLEVDGVRLNSTLDLGHYAIGYVPQRIYVAGATIRENIAFGGHSGDIDADRLSRAVTHAGLAPVLAKLPQALDTVIGEQQLGLSGGEMQRIGIARALYRNPCLLILDEATAGLDERLEQDVVTGCRDWPGINTLVVISHRRSTLALCSRVINLEQG